ncbi:hypothetical protein VTK73DRAFT_6077 [Phialemonium thermophilum]|uniref:ABC transporter domain-containing protein n=1 Tax=Phialemonium thermophilum TaxID=223376 RepID=A0ABR3WKL5_9PEZI
MPHATLRHNIDAAGAMSGVTLVRALEKVHLWGHFSAHQQRHCASPTHTEDGVDDEGQHPVSPEVILDHRLSSLPVLSGGQTQLFTLARALVRREAMAAERPYEDSEENDGRGTPKPVLLLDEATSSLDPATEEIMHNVIDEEFVQRGHTVVLVTHRPDMLVGKMRRGRDAFVWMKDGTIERVVDAEEVLGQERCT